MPKLFVQTIWFVANNLFSFRTLVDVRKIRSTQPIPIKTLGIKSLMSFPMDSILHEFSQLIDGGIKCILCDFTERRVLNTCVWFPSDFIILSHDPLSLLILPCILWLCNKPCLWVPLCWILWFFLQNHQTWLWPLGHKILEPPKY